MKCISCNTTLSPAFKHALTQNVCPACGGPILDEESLALIEDVRGVVAAEAHIREETAHRLAMAIISRYDLSIRENAELVVPKKQVRTHSAPIKTAPPSAAQQVSKKQEGVISAEEIERRGLSDKEREAIMTDAISKHYNMMDGLTDGAAQAEENSENFDLLQGALVGESEENPILERERLMRLKKQQAALSGGSGSFRRSS